LTPQGFENLGFAFAAEDCKLMERERERERELALQEAQNVDVNMGDGGRFELL
jgi:hypothetical protein